MTNYRAITLPPNAEIFTVSDQAMPMQQWVEIDLMVIDDGYQRPINQGGMATIRRIAANFRWDCFSPVLLAPIEGGKFSVIDGQHRVHAAMMAGVKSVPAMIVPISPTEQARAFIQVNSARISMSQFNLFKAGLTANEPWALAANKAVMDAGCRLMSFAPSQISRKPGDVLSVALIRDMVGKGHGQAVTVSLTALRGIEDMFGSSAVVLYADRILSPLIRAVAEFPTLTAGTLTEILRKRRPPTLVETAERLAASENRSKALVVREAFMRTITGHLAQVAA